jgi:2-hydroxy-6-oxonona-2,4-dienedioate hydrolase
LTTRARFTEILGAQTRYYEAGAGKAVLLVHGVGMSADVWFRAVPALGKDYYVCAPDLLDNGFTESGPYAGGPPQSLIVDHLLALADHLKLERFSLVGSSLGCALGTLLYLRAPERVEKMVFVGPGAVIGPGTALAEVLEAAAVNGRSALENPSYESCRARLTRVFHDPAAIPEWMVAMQMTMYGLPGTLERFDRRMSGMRMPTALRELAVHDRLPSIAVPSLIIIGREDPRGDYDQTVAAARRLPLGEIVTYDGCGHWPQLEHAAQFNSDVAAFLSRR